MCQFAARAFVRLNSMTYPRYLPCGLILLDFGVVLAAVAVYNVANQFDEDRGGSGIHDV